MAPSRLGLGTSRIGSFNNPASLRQSEDLIRAAIDLGLRVIDTASIYGQGDSERTIGRAVAGRRGEVFLITKGARDFSGGYRLLRPFKPAIRPLLSALGKGHRVATARRGDALVADWSPARIAASLEASLRRLGTDHVDAYLLHSPPPEVAGDPAVEAALIALRQNGKALRIGVSCDDLATLTAALTRPSLTVVELPWDVILALGAMRQQLATRGILVIAREVIAQQAPASADAALRRALADPGIDCTLIGTTRLAHLRQAAALAESAPA